MTCAIKGGKRTRKHGRRRGKKQQKGGGFLDYFGLGKKPEQPAAPTDVKNTLLEENKEEQVLTDKSQVVAKDKKPTAVSSSSQSDANKNETRTDEPTKPADATQPPPKNGWFGLFGGKRKTHKKSKK